MRAHAAATASRHWFAASARNIRSVERETRWRWRLKVLWTAACMLRKRWAERAGSTIGEQRTFKPRPLCHRNKKCTTAVYVDDASLRCSCAPFLFRWMGGRDQMLANALSYANVALGGAVCICASNLLGNAVRGTGNMSLPASVLVGCVLMHIAISPVLIFGFGPLPALGPAGAGLGLVLPFAGGSAVMIWYLRSRAIVRLNFRGVTPRWELFADILKVGVPGLINIAITNLSVVMLAGIAGQMGRDTALGYAMGARLEYIQQPI